MNSTELKNTLDYNPETGTFVWKFRNGNNRYPVGSIAGSPNPRGYWYIHIGDRRYLVHRLAWLFTYGALPSGPIDHKDGNPSNNRITNLRVATKSQNGANAKRASNNTSGFKGVYWKKNKWRARIYKNNVEILLGSFSTAEEAHAAYMASAKKMFREFARSH